MKTFLFVRNSLKKPPTRLQSVTTHFSRKPSHPLRIIKQYNPCSLTSKTNFAHYDYKPSNPKKFFFKSVPLFPLSQNPHLQSKTNKKFFFEKCSTQYLTHYNSGVRRLFDHHVAAFRDHPRESAILISILIQPSARGDSKA